MFIVTILHIFFVWFTDKPLSAPLSLSPRAIELREKWGIELDSLDYPVSKHYTDSLSSLGVNICHTSRWMNGATCHMSSELAQTVSKLSFVKHIEMTRNDSSIYSALIQKRIPTAVQGDSIPYSNQPQIDMLNLQPLHQAGYEGQGIVLGVCDAGFYNAHMLDCFRPSSLELGHYDFTDEKSEFYGSEGAHGVECLSTISALTDEYRGTATKAPYYLFRSEEMHTESPKEVDNLVVALETADSLGVNVFSVSLGYYFFDQPEWNFDPDMLDGRSTRASLAAGIAARKGMLICASAGNEGESIWQKVCTPADADSILAVGAVHLDGTIASFSSYGTTSDGRIKPDVCALGVQAAVIAPDGNVLYANGTSFAAPQIAGLAASLWSAYPNENAMQIRERIIMSADKALCPDSTRYGYGIPNAWNAYTMYNEDFGYDPAPKEHKSQCILRNGQVIIVRNGESFTLLGQRIE